MTLQSPPTELLRDGDTLERALKGLVADRPLPLYRMMAYHMGWVEQNGEERIAAPGRLRVHGSLALLMCRGLGGAADEALPHACALEYLFNHTLIHDDVRDGNAERDGRGSVWWSWGPAQAINTGDGMHALARLALYELRDRGGDPETVSRSVRLLDEANLHTCEGQYRDITLQERLDIGVDEYLAMAEMQTGALLACAAKLGALAAGQLDGAQEEALEVFGRKLGAAVRVADDLALFWPDGQRDEAQQGRLVAKKKTLPVAHALGQDSPTVRRKVGEIYMERVIDPAAAERLIEVLDGAGSRAFTIETTERLRDEAVAALGPAGLPEPLVDSLRDVAGFLASPGGDS